MDTDEDDIPLMPVRCPNCGSDPATRRIYEWITQTAVLAICTVCHARWNEQRKAE